MARIDHRTAVYNTTASPEHLFGTFATSYKYEDIVRNHASGRREVIHRFGTNKMSALESIINIFRNSRPWFDREATRAELHPVIRKLLRSDNAHYLTDWREMVLEYPHVADLDNTKVAFTENDAKGQADRQTVTTLGKYIKRHAPEIPDHVLRDIVALSITSVELVYDLAGMIEAVQTGPKSCMQSERWNIDNHPYNVYDPQYGWHMAVRRQGGAVVGRCLCLTHGGQSLFVRSYKPHPENDGYSQSDEGMNAWLRERGYEHASGWPDGAKLRRIEAGGDIVAPYIDGCSQSCSDHGTHLEMDENGDLECASTNGYADNRDRTYCADCEDAFDSEDGRWVGYHEDHHVCDSCAHDYTYVIGRRGSEYYIPDNDVVWVNDQAYDENYLESNDIVYCEDDSEYRHKDDCVELDCEGTWIAKDVADEGDTYVCLDADNRIWGRRDDCWYCETDEQWYSSDSCSEYYADQEPILHDHHVVEFRAAINY